jgi:hypothetical protein
MSDENTKNNLLLNMILVHFNIADTLTADDLQDYMDFVWGEDE